MAVRQVSLSSALLLKSPSTTTAEPAGNAATRPATRSDESICDCPRRSVKCVLNTYTWRPLARWWNRAQVTMRPPPRRRLASVRGWGGASGVDVSQKLPDATGLSSP